MENLSRHVRERDVHRLIEFVTPSSSVWSNWLIQGLPNCGVEEVFAGLIKYLRSLATDIHNLHVFEIDFSNYWMESVPRCVSRILAMLPQNPTDSAVSTSGATEDLSGLLSELKMRISSLAKEGNRLVFAFVHFDSIQKFHQPEQVQHLLNTFQSLCYNPEYQTTNIVQCYRDIEAICVATSYSDYYKIFGANHYRVLGISDQKLEDLLKTECTHLSSSQLCEVVKLSGGYPEHAEVLLRFLGNVECRNLDECALDALTLTFREWESCLSSEEIEVLHAIAAGQTLGPEYLSSRRKLVRKGIIRDLNGHYQVISPLFDAFLSVRMGETYEQQSVFIRKAGVLPDPHRRLLEQLFLGHYYIEWSYMQEPRAGDATVYFVSGEDLGGVAYRPCIVKINNVEKSKAEIEKMQTAREMLGSLVPSIIKRHSLKGQEAIVLEYATGDNRDYQVQQFAQLYRESTAEKIEDYITKVFGKALFPLYRAQTTRSEAAKQLYFLPRVHQGEYEQIARIARKSRFYDKKEEKLHLPGTDISLPNPGVYLCPPQTATHSSPYQDFFVKKYPVGLCSVHGDLNPRNFLLDGIDNIHLIDFSEMKREGARFLDFVRIEAEITFKLADVNPDSLASMVSLETLLIDCCESKKIQTVKQLPLDSDARKLAFAVAALRENARAICTSPIHDLQFAFEYLVGLLAQTLRISLFQDYLDEIQQEFAVLSAALLTHKIEEIMHMDMGNQAQ